MIRANLSFEPKSIIRHIQKNYKYTISYEKAWSAKQKVLEMSFGTFEATYDNISRLLAVICQRNRRIYYDLKSLDREQDPPFILQRVFFSLGPCINAFQHCRMQLDRSLLAALADRWRPETHTFHLPCGEMAPTLQDVSYLLGLPSAGEAVGPVAVPPTWRAELQERFAPVNPPHFLHVPDASGAAKGWVIQYRVRTIIFN
jgi:hypothetical protein